MIKVYCVSLAAALIAAPAFAQAPAGSPAQPQPAARSAAADPNEVVCQRVEQIGSRLGKKRICMTRSEWANQQLQDRQAVEKIQTERGMKAE
jgi:invasion protein IalB